MTSRIVVAFCMLAPLTLTTVASASAELRVRGGGQFDDGTGSGRPSTIAFSGIATDAGVQGEVQYSPHGESADAMHGEVVCVTATSFGFERQGVGRIDFRIRGRDGVDEFFEIQAIDNGEGQEGQDTIALFPISEEDVCSPFGPLDENYVPLPVTDLGLARGNVQVDGVSLPPFPPLLPN